MKTASAALKAFLSANTNMYMADLYTFTLRNGTVLRYATSDINISRQDSFSRNSVAAFYDNNGILQTAGVNVARYGYNPSSIIGPKQPIGLILEPAATNQMTFGQNMQGYVTNNNVAFSVNYLTSPDGTQNAAFFVPDTSTTDHWLASHGFFSPTISSLQKFSISIFIKRPTNGGEFNRYFWRAFRSADSAHYTGVAVDLSLGIVSAVTQGSGVVTSANIQTLPNGWYRISANGCQLDAGTTSPISDGGYCSNLPTAGSLPDVSQPGDGINGFGLYGDSFETSDSSTSFIPVTVNSSVTRQADVFSGTIFAAKDVLVTGGKLQNTRGLKVNESDVTCVPSSTSTVSGTPFIAAAVNGLFDRATVQRDRVFMPQWGDTSLGAVTVFLGEITDINPMRTNVVFKCKDATNLLNIYMPLHQFQSNCSWTFGDSNCTINRASLTISGIVTAGTTAQVINCALSNPDGFFNQGVIKFTSGLNNGYSRTVKSWVAGQATLVANMPNMPMAGDTFTITPGCDKTTATCQNTYNNLIHFGGEPYVPVPESAL